MPQNGNQTKDLQHNAEMEAQLSEIVNNIRILVDSDESSEDLIYLRQQKWLFEGILKK